MPVLPVAAVISALASGTYTVTRYGAGSYVEGEHTEGTASTFDIKASVQPMSGRELMKLPEGERTQDNLVVLTASELRTREGTAQADRLSIDGATYEVLGVEDWYSEGGFYRAHVRRVTP